MGKGHRVHLIAGHLPEGTIVSSSFAENDLQSAGLYSPTHSFHIEGFAENDLQSTGLYSPTHSFPIEGLLHSVPANIPLSHRYNTHSLTHTHTHDEFAHQTHKYCKPA